MADAEKKKAIEQLWYTWSDVGLSTVYAGARIRAASEGLSDIYSERVQSIDRYTRYTLPPGTDRYAITPQQAPVCLAYVRTNWDELILVHKQYVGLDGVGRPGNFFTHLFALGRDMDEFSPAEAIWLWNSPIWKTSDAELDRRSVKLETVSLDEIEDAQTFRPTYIQVQQYLPFLIEAYLSRRTSSPIYLAAPANASDMIANLIAGLAWCLPRQLLATLTFSTYEPDWSKATTQIVGVSWVPGAAKEQRPEAGFTPQFYQEQLALNCATGECSHLERHPLVFYNPLINEFARFAANCLLYDEMEELDNLIEQAEQDPQLNLEMFLRLYSNLVVDKQHLRLGDIEEYLSSPSYRLARLADHTFREQIIDQAVQNQRWWQQHLKPILLNLRQQSEKERSSRRGMEKQPSLAAPKQRKASSKEPRKRSNKRKAAADSSNAPSLEQVLSQLARNAVPIIITTMRQLARGGIRGAADSIEEGVSVGAITALLELMDSALASDDPYGIWKSLCEGILASTDACRFLTEHWEIHSYLLQKWGKLLPAEKNEEQMRPALVISWSHLGEFLALRLHQQHPQWVVFALQELLREKSGLTTVIVQQLEQRYAADVQSLLEAFIKDSGCWSSAVSFVIALSEKRYAGGKQYETQVELLLTQLLLPRQYLLAKDLVVALTIAGHRGSDDYLQQVEQLLKSLLEHAQTQAAGHELFDQLARSTYRGKKRLVPIALPFKGSLEDILQRLFPNLEELNDFFVCDGMQYLQGHRETMFGVYQKLLPLSHQGQCLSILLDFSIEENYVFQVWNVAQPTDAEMAMVLKKYGARYLSNYQYGSHLAQAIIKQFAFLVERNYPVKELLFALFTITQSTYLEALLSIAQPGLSLDDIRAFFNEYGTLPQYRSFFSGQSPAMLSLLRTYLQSFSARQLEDPVSRNFLLSLTPQTKLHKALDANESKWVVIVSFLDHPDISSSWLKRLVTALYYLSPLDASEAIPELARAFVKCVGSVDDLYSIFSGIYKGASKAWKADVYLLFYAIAQYAAEEYLQHLNRLFPYVVFALTCPLEGQNFTGRAHFIQVFLDRLLYNIDNPSAWKSLHASLCAQQPSLSQDALERWQNYLHGLQLLEQVQSGQPVQSVATTGQEKGSPVPTGGIRGLWRRLLKKDFGTAEFKVREALKNRKITQIVNTYQRLTQLEPESYLLRFYQGLSSVEKERLRVACDFSNAYENALRRKGVFRLETERQLDSLRERIENLDLECTKKQQKRLSEALGHVAETDSQRLVAQSQSLDSSGLATQKSLPAAPSSIPAQQEQEKYLVKLGQENRPPSHKWWLFFSREKPDK